MMEKLRTLSVNERAFLEAVAYKLDPAQAEQLQLDIAAASAWTDGDFVRIVLRGYIRPDYAGHENLPFEGSLRDCDGGALSLLANVDQNGRLLELEFLWWENSSAIAPDWTTLAVVPGA